MFVEVGESRFGALLAGVATASTASTGAHGQDQVRVDAADHGSSLVRSVVCSGASALASGTRDRNAGWVGRVVLHGWDNLHTTFGEGIAVDVGQIPEDAVARWGELELRDGSGKVVCGRQLD